MRFAIRRTSEATPLSDGLEYWVFVSYTQDRAAAVKFAIIYPASLRQELDQNAISQPSR